MPSDRRAEALLRAERLADRQEAVGRLRSAVYAAPDRNWGIGDFGDLRLMVEQVGNAAALSLASIRSMRCIRPTRSASPYSPSSRRWLNLAYIDVNAVEDFQRSDAAQRWWQKPATQKQLAKRAPRSGWITPP